MTGLSARTDHPARAPIRGSENHFEPLEPACAIVTLG
jgi:hypothetical protein